ncbi:MAG: hypothetical protein OXU77_22520 [Gammaproteobacteria bacterium]|nr:hypothetical protein [Gammaproteobacteria bacterium]
MKSYLFTYSPMCADWHAQAILNETNAVTTWVQPFPNAAIVISSLDAKDLGAVLRSRLGATWFVVTEIHGATIDGLLPGNLWQFINSAPATALPTFSQYLPAALRESQEAASQT